MNTQKNNILGFILSVFFVGQLEVYSQTIYPFSSDYQSSTGSSVYFVEDVIFLSGSYYQTADSRSQIFFSRFSESLQIEDIITFESEMSEFSGKSIKIGNNVFIVSEYLNTFGKTFSKVRALDLSNDSFLEKTFDSTGTSQGLSRIDANDSMVVVAGFINGVLPVITQNYHYLVALNHQLEVIWDLILGVGEINYLKDVKFFGDKIFICGDIEVDGVLNAYLACLNLKGEILWQKSIGDEFANGTQGMWIENNRIILFGESTVSLTDPTFDILLAEVDFMGNTISYNYLNLGGSDALFSISKVGNHFVGSGYSTLNEINFQYKSILVLWDEDLNYLKTEVLNPELNGIAYNISSDGEDFVVTGFVNLNFNSQVFLSRYSIEEVFTVKEESLNIGFKAFPNPVITGTSLFVDIDIEWSNPMINLIDVNGKVWVQRNISGAVSNIDFPIPLFVPPGIYYVQISDKVKKVTQKIVVSR